MTILYLFTNDRPVPTCRGGVLKPRSHDTSDWDSRDNQYLRVLVFDRSFPLVSSALRGSKDCIGLGFYRLWALLPVHNLDVPADKHQTSLVTPAFSHPSPLPPIAQFSVGPWPPTGRLPIQLPLGQPPPKQPANLWDEFVNTATYLTTLTAAIANGGKTPYHMWFGRAPSLSHLREIGCRAYALTLTHHSKLAQRSAPCVLIGYAPHAKAYRLWDPSNRRVFNSFHVSFIEHLHSAPTPLLPGTTLGLSSPHAPATWDAPGYLTPVSDASPESSPFLSYNQPLSPSFSADETPPISSSTSPCVIPPNPSISPHLHDQTQSRLNNNATSTNAILQDDIETPNIPSNSRLNHHVRSTDTDPHNNSLRQIDQTPVNLPTVDTISDTLPDLTPSPRVSTPASTPSSLSTLTPSPPPEIPPPILRRSSRIPIPANRVTSNDGLTHGSRLSAAMADIRSSGVRRQEERSSRRATPSGDHTTAFISLFSPMRDSHDLLPADICAGHGLTSVDEVLAALTDGSIEPTVDLDDEPSWGKALASPEREYWIAGGREELKSLEDLKVFVLVPRSEVPRGQRPLKGKLVCKRKRDDAGNVVRYKVRYVAKGYAQRYGVDYDKTTAPTVRLESFRALLHTAATLDWDLRQFDIKTAFLHGILPEDETMYMEQPEGFEEAGKEDWVMKLMKSIYGMKQASRIWNKTFNAAIVGWGFERLACEWCVYKRQSATGTIIFVVHVDDILATASSPSEIDRFKAELTSRWEISDLGEPRYALGIGITRDRSRRTISLSQTALIDRVVEEFGQTAAHAVDTPMVAGLQLQRPDHAAPVPPEVTDWISRTPYRSLVGSLMYIAVATRPDISYAVGRLSSFCNSFRLEHWSAAIRVLRYLKSTRTMCLNLGGTNQLRLLGYSDSDYANCMETSRSVGGYCFTLGSGMISWSSRKQPTVADSSCYAEYIALQGASHEAIFLRQLLDGLMLLPPGPSPLYCDNDAASRLAEDHVWHSHTKHIRVKYHYVREQVLTGELSVQRVNSKDNTADILTKPLGRVDFLRLRQYLGLNAEEKPP